MPVHFYQNIAAILVYVQTFLIEAPNYVILARFVCIRRLVSGAVHKKVCGGNCKVDMNSHPACLLVFMGLGCGPQGALGKCVMSRYERVVNEHLIRTHSGSTVCN